MTSETTLMLLPAHPPMLPAFGQDDIIEAVERILRLMTRAGVRSTTPDGWYWVDDARTHVQLTLVSDWPAGRYGPFVVIVRGVVHDVARDGLALRILYDDPDHGHGIRCLPPEQAQRLPWSQAARDRYGDYAAIEAARVKRARKAERRLGGA